VTASSASVRAAIFDFDGVIVDEPLHFRSMRDAPDRGSRSPRRVLRPLRAYDDRGACAWPWSIGRPPDPGLIEILMERKQDRFEWSCATSPFPAVEP
jgi:beta-phosphoglucomutase-like phosphatase (HAD superfamily)